MPPIFANLTCSAGIESEFLEFEQFVNGDKLFYWVVPKGATLGMTGSEWGLSGVYIKDIKYIELD